MPRRSWIPDHSGPREPWDRLLEQLQPFGAELSQHNRKPGYVSARLRKIRDQTRSNGISDEGHDDGDVRCGVLRARYETSGPDPIALPTGWEGSCSSSPRETRRAAGGRPPGRRG